MKKTKHNFSLLNMLCVATLLFTAVLLIGPSCQSPPSIAPKCDTGITPFKNIWQAVFTQNPTFEDIVTMDLITHEYKFKLDKAKTVCSVGYQGDANLYASSTPYTIEIYNITDNQVVYTGAHIFKSNATDYQSVGRVTLLANKTYSIRRTSPNSSFPTGRVLRFSAGASPFPFTLNDMTILSTSFYDNTNTTLNYGIPYIDIVFES